VEPFIITNADIVIRLVLAMLLGCLIGSERLFSGKTAGMRTYALVSLGSAVYVIVSLLVTNEYLYVANFDPMRMASQVIVGVGFLGAGLIIFKDSKISGLTTAAGLWIAAGIGVSVGYGLFEVAILASFLTLFIFIVLGLAKRKLQHMPSFHFPDEHQTTDEDDET
jgi:putative Mg2+ transporter-C (MgtC) family protein